MLSSFSDLAEVATACPKNCTHKIATIEPDCALNAWADGSPQRSERLASLRRVLDSSEINRL